MRHFCFYAPLTFLVFILITMPLSGQSDWTTPFEKDPNTSATYEQTIDYYQRLARAYPQYLDLRAVGATDAGAPLHLLVFATDGQFSPEAARRDNKVILLINNAIHPGEPCGVDASMLFFRDLVQNPEWRKRLQDVVIAAIPFYNIGGGLNRGPYSRANQNGPNAHGFRGNARNLDLNRDFIKADSRNAQTFNQLYAQWRPHIFIDNHTSNGADYAYVLTLIATQHNKLGGPLAQLLQNDMLPFLFQAMEQTPYPMIPYVYVRNTPREGIAGFLDLPRYSSGYAALHHALSFMPEAHMFKPFADRVRSVYHFLQVAADYAQERREAILTARRESERLTAQRTVFPINWTLDRSRVDSLRFRGYTAKTKTSVVTGQDRLYYDRNDPWEDIVPHFNHYRATDSVHAPVAYILPQAYQEVAQRLLWNGVRLHQLTADVRVPVDFYYIEDFQTRNAYEGHYLHYNVALRTETASHTFRAGDFVLFTDQPTNRYVVETMEPHAPDSWFAWNFFDGILQQKEYFSSYVFEDLAAEYLEEHPELAQRLADKKAEDSEFATSARAQLDFIYRHSPYYEPTHRRYPVGLFRAERSALPVRIVRGLE